MKHYVYMYCRPNGIPVYVGRGTGYRFNHCKKPSSDSHIARVWKKYNCQLPCIKIDCGSLEIACKLEQELILAIGREMDGGPLVNLSVGGDTGSLGVVYGKGFRDGRSIRAKQMWERPGFREFMNSRYEVRKGNTQPRSVEFKNAVSNTST